ncbi:MAG: hypothetical protein ACTH0V_15225 [Microbacteriaceae bacterium]|uniref:hypothetical protein n=1 Tax=Microbacterium sp. TaxID=51671 RepID=UPI003F9A730E
MRYKKTQGGVLTGLLALTLTIAGVPAHAADNSELEIDTHNVVERAIASAPDNAEPATVDASGDFVQARTDSVNTSLALDAGEGIDIEAQVEDTSLQVQLELPRQFQESTPELVDNSVVYEAQDGGQEQLIAHSLPDGSTRVQTVINTPNDAHEFEYVTPGFTPHVNSDGSAVVTNKDGISVPVDAPWAVDAAGEAVPTHYKVSNNELIQVVVPDASTQYPIVADPTWRWDSAAWGATLTRSETKGITNYSSAVGTCTFLGLKSGPLAAACGGMGYYILQQANTANRDKMCLHFVVAPIPGPILRVPCVA